MKILMICPALPVPLNSGGNIRVFNLVRHLSATEQIDFLTLDDGSTPAEEIQALKPFCGLVDIVVPRKKPLWIESLRVARRLAKGEPFCNKYVDYPELKARVRQLTRTGRYDIVHIEHSHLAGLLDCADRKTYASAILSTQNVAADQFYRMYRFERNPVEKIKLLLTWLPMKRWEGRTAAKFDRIVAVCERDKSLLLKANPALRIGVVPNGVDTELNRPLPRAGRRANLLIVGSMDYRPNVDAVLYFLEAVFPLILKSVPACTLTVVGKNPPDCLRRLNRPPVVRICADAPDVRPHHREAMVSPVALRSGGGSRLKILESLALGTPVVSTRVGCEGLDVVPNRHILVSDEPVEFATETARLLREPDLWTRLSENGRRLVTDRYDWKRMAGLMRAIYLQGTQGKVIDS
jgi:glycosyltransferase involved in cell wall biosynthesis